ncbi:MAG TPA: SLC13 family permease [Candidatus Limnocylindrales bacterium]|nr:SLC13 family permease [Candidatus Limnocylindrales bacterium]
MSLEAWITLGVIVVIIFVLMREMVLPSAAILGGTVFLFLVGVIDSGQAFAGFSNEAPFIIGALLVLARAVDLSGLLQPIVGALFGKTTGTRAILTRLLFPVAGSSAFMNNTTIVAMSAPPVMELARQRALPPSRFLIPLSYAAVLGGVITTIGTSTNLTVSGLLGQAGLPTLGLFEITPVGLPVALVGVAAIVIFAPRLLPDRGENRPQIVDGGREFTVSMQVMAGGPLDGQTVEQGGLRRLQGVFLVEIEREEQVIAPVAPEETLQGGDRLTFVGRVDDIVDLQRMRGLMSTESPQLQRLGGARHAFYEVVVGSSDLVGRTLRQAGFRGRYNAAVLAINRQGQRVQAKLGEVPLHTGDTLLVLADAGFRDRWRDSREFLLIAPLSGVPPTRPRKAALVGATVVGFVALTGTGTLTLLQGALLVPLVLVGTGAVSVAEARRAIDLNLLVLIAASFGLGAAVEASGLGQVIADAMLAAAAPLGPLAVLGAVFLATILLTELVSNNAAAVLIFPVALATAAGLGVDPRPFVLVVLFGASLSFLTPIGYQTNMMVYGLGGYRFMDFPRLGAPVIVAAGAVALLLVPIFFPLRPL